MAERIKNKTWLSGLEHDILDIFEIREVKWERWIYMVYDDERGTDWDESLYFEIEGTRIVVNVRERNWNLLAGLKVGIYNDDSDQPICDSGRIFSGEVSVEELQASGRRWKETRRGIARNFESLSTNKALLDSGYISKERLERVRYRAGVVLGLLESEIKAINVRNIMIFHEKYRVPRWKKIVNYFLGVIGALAVFLLLEVIVSFVSY